MANMPERLALPARFELYVDQAYSALCTMLFPCAAFVIPKQSKVKRLQHSCLLPGICIKASCGKRCNS